MTTKEEMLETLDRLMMACKTARATLEIEPMVPDGERDLSRWSESMPADFMIGDFFVRDMRRERDKFWNTYGKITSG